MERMHNERGQHLYVARKLGEHLIIAGEQGLIRRSTDNGETFEHVPSPYKGSWFAGEFLRQDEIVLAGLRGNVWRTGDGGRRWQQVVNPNQASITSMQSWKDQLLLGSQAGQVLRLEGNELVRINKESLAPLAGLVARKDQLFGFGPAGFQPIGGNAR